jgi:hypothetical protein
MGCAGLRAQLRRIDESRAIGHGHKALWRAIAATGTAIAIGLIFTLPAVRATAQQFLDLFRVTSFVAVPVQPQNIERLANGFDLSRLIGEQIEVSPEPTHQVFGTVQEAAAAAGMNLRVPQYLPVGFTLARAQVDGDRVTRIVASIAKLRSVMELFDGRDLTVPESLDGEVAIVTLPTVTSLVYESPRSRIELAQASPPQVLLPAGIDLPLLGEIALRLIGLSPKQAQDLAQTIDWRSTLVVPIPPNVESFQQSTVQGYRALQLVLRGNTGLRNMIVWSDGERVYALSGSLRLPELIVVANSLGPA